MCFVRSITNMFSCQQTCTARWWRGSGANTVLLPCCSVVKLAHLRHQEQGLFHMCCGLTSDHPCRTPSLKSSDNPLGVIYLASPPNNQLEDKGHFLHCLSQLFKTPNILKEVVEELCGILRLPGVGHRNSFVILLTSTYGLHRASL